MGVVGPCSFTRCSMLKATTQHGTFLHIYFEAKRCRLDYIVNLEWELCLV